MHLLIELANAIAESGPAAECNAQAVALMCALRRAVRYWPITRTEFDEFSGSVGKAEQTHAYPGFSGQASAQKNGVRP